jgi:hypothetical protein
LRLRFQHGLRGRLNGARQHAEPVDLLGQQVLDVRKLLRTVERRLADDELVLRALERPQGTRQIVVDVLVQARERDADRLALARNPSTGIAAAASARRLVVVAAAERRAQEERPCGERSAAKDDLAPVKALGPHAVRRLHFCDVAMHLDLQLLLVVPAHGFPLSDHYMDGGAYIVGAPGNTRPQEN